MQVLHSLNVVCVDVEARVCHSRDALAVSAEVWREALHQDGRTAPLDLTNHLRKVGGASVSQVWGGEGRQTHTRGD